MLTFAEFLSEARGRDPYPWQARLAEVLATGSAQEIPAWITAPTGSGKTTTIDAAIYALAAQAGRRPIERTVGVRLIWVIERRLLVDEVYQQARALAMKLTEAAQDNSAVLHECAVRLLALAADGRWTPQFDAASALDAGFAPLEVERWRGGVRPTLERRSPFQPAVITSTVQQVGSRLLFRGYGVSNRSRALEAALVSRDAIAFLDEAHLAVPFTETVQAVERHQATHPREVIELPPPLRLITLTATPPDDAVGPKLGLGAEDRAALGQRLTGRKTLRVVEAEGKPVDQLAALAEAALQHGIDDSPPIVAVVVNRVRTATELLARLANAVAKAPQAPVLALLIGPQRPADRRAQLAEVWPSVFDGEKPERPVILVTTQTFEVGLDADVSHLITQSASVSSLVQRFGRANRKGERSDAPITVVRDEGFPLYAEDEPVAWEWLLTIQTEGGDVSVGALLERPRPEQSKPPGAPVLTDLIVQQLAQTSVDLPVLQEPDVDGLLRGATEDVSRDVNVVWRADLIATEGVADGPGARQYRRALMRLAPPSADEALTLPISAVRQLLAGDRRALRKSVLDQADLATSAPVAANESAVLPFVVLRGREVLAGVVGRPADDEEIGPAQIRPGDTVVLPVEAGGADGAGLNPAAVVATESRLEFDAEAGPALPFVRVTPRGLVDAAGDRSGRWQLVSTRVDALIGAVADDPDGPQQPRRADAWLKALTAGLPDGHPEAAALAATLGDDSWAPRRLARVHRDDAEEPVGLDGPNARDASGKLGWVLRRVTSTADREDRFAPQQPPPELEAHLYDVAERAGSWAEVIGVEPAIARAVRLAGAAHDLGKFDPRTQAFFAGGVRRIGRPALAKSEFGTSDPARSSLARAASGLPSGLRHELASVAALSDSIYGGRLPSWAEGADDVLALHLVGTHHGWGRPAFPIPGEGTPPARFHAKAGGLEGAAMGDGADGWQDGAWDQRYWYLHDRLGPWTLAYLEALVVLADRTISKEGR